MGTDAMAIELHLNDIIKVTIQQSLYGQLVLNSLHYKIIDLGTAFALFADSVCQDLVDRFYSATLAGNIGYKMQQIQRNSLTHDELRLSRESAPKTPQVLKGVGSPGAVITGHVPGANIAGVITKKSDVYGRSGQGAFHIAGQVVDDCADGKWDLTNITGMAAVGDQMRATLTLGDAGYKLQPGIYNSRAATPAFSALTTFVVHDEVRIMRRRTVGVGR